MDAVDLPAAEQFARQIVGTLEEGQAVNEAHLPHVRAVKACQREVVFELQRVIPGQPDPAVFIGHILGFAQRVSAFQQQPVLEGTVDGRLQRVITATGTCPPIVDRGVAGHGEILTTGIRIRRRAGFAVVDVQIGVTAVSTRADITRFDDDVPWQFVFKREVPLLDDSAVEATARAGESFEVIEVWRSLNLFENR